MKPYPSHDKMDDETHPNKIVAVQARFFWPVHISLLGEELLFQTTNGIIKEHQAYVYGK